MDDNTLQCLSCAASAVYQRPHISDQISRSAWKQSAAHIMCDNFADELCRLPRHEASSVACCGRMRRAIAHCKLLL